MAKGIVGEQAVHVGPLDASILRGRSVRAAFDRQHGTFAVASVTFAEMNLVAVDRRPAGAMQPAHPPRCLCRRHYGPDFEQSKSVRCARLAVASRRIVDRLPQQLEASAEAENTAATPDVRLDVGVPTLLSQEGKIAPWSTSCPAG